MKRLSKTQIRRVWREVQQHASLDSTYTPSAQAHCTISMKPRDGVVLRVSIDIEVRSPWGEPFRDWRNVCAEFTAHEVRAGAQYLITMLRWKAENVPTLTHPQGVLQGRERYGQAFTDLRALVGVTP